MSKRTRSRILLAVTTAGLASLLACDSAETVAVDPVRYGESLCAECGAVVRDPRFAAVLVGTDGEVRTFDDPGCLFRAKSAADGASSTARFHDYASDQWVEAKQAWFAHTAQIDSPQEYGWAAFGSFGAAQDAVTSAAGTGEILPYTRAAARMGAAAASGG